MRTTDAPFAQSHKNNSETFIPPRRGMSKTSLKLVARDGEEGRINLPSVQNEAGAPIERPKNLIPTSNLTFVLAIPLFYNPDSDGIRKAVEARKITQTVKEIQFLFHGYSCSPIVGWYRDGSTGRQFTDELLKFEIDCVLDKRTLKSLRAWKTALEKRFRQSAIYFRFSGPIICW